MHSFFEELLRLTPPRTEGPPLPDRLALELAAETLLNGGTRTYSPHSHIIHGLHADYLTNGKIRPQHGLLRLLGAPVRIFGSGVATDLLVHPNSMLKGDLKNRAQLDSLPSEVLSFYALSSLRSVLYAADGEWHRGKLHLEGVQISRYFRNLGGRTIEHSVAVSDELVARWSDIQLAYGSHAVRLGFYEEFSGAVLKNTDETNRNGEWGSLRRSLDPLGCEAEGCAAIPLFALYGWRASYPEAPTLLEVIIEVAGEEPGAFIFGQIMEPVIRAWVAIFEQSGVIWEPHGQNMVLMLDLETLQPKGVVLRDADTAVSSGRRRELGRSCEAFFDRNVHDGQTTEELPCGDRSEISRVIDSSMGRNTFDYLAGLYQEVYCGDPEALRSQCRQLFAKIWPLGSDWLPDEVFGYREAPLSDDRNCYPLESKPESPCWRP